MSSEGSSRFIVPPALNRSELSWVPKTVTPAEQLRQSKLEESQRIAKICFPDPVNGRILPVVYNRPDQDETTVDYLSGVSGDPERLEEVISGTGEFILRDNYDPFGSDSLQSVVRYLTGYYDTWHDLCEFSPDGQSEEGYNAHGRDHHNKVTRGVIKLLQMSDEDTDELKRGIVAALSHDNGYVFDNNSHALIGARMIGVVLPSLANSRAVGESYSGQETNLDIVRRIIANHDSDILRANLSSLSSLPEAERLQAMRSFLKPAGLAVIITDKGHIEKKRISSNIRHHVVKRDKHAEVNLLGKSLGISLFGDRAVWNLEFDPNITEQDKKTYPSWAVRLAREQELGSYSIHFRQWEELFNQLYTERSIVMVEALHALFPMIDGVEIAFSDKRGERRSRFYERGNLDHQFERLRHDAAEKRRSNRR